MSTSPHLALGRSAGSALSWLLVAAVLAVSATNVSSDSHRPGTVPIVSIAATKALAAERSSAPPAFSQAVFTVSRHGPDGEPVTAGQLPVFYEVSGTAANGVDYTRLRGQVRFAAGASDATVVVTPLEDALAEGMETVLLTLRPSPSSPHHNRYLIGEHNAAAAWILDLDPVLVLFPTKTHWATYESAAYVQIVPYPHPLPHDVWFDCVLHDGTAIAGTDYVDVSGRYRLPAGASTCTVRIPLRHAGWTAPELSFSFTITNVSPPHALGNSQCVLTLFEGGGAIPWIASPPSSRTKCLGQNVTFDVSADAWGSSILSYQWFWNSSALPGATTRNVTFTDLQFADTGFYSVTVGTTAGGIATATAALTVVPTPTGQAAVDPTFDPGAGVDPTYGYAVVASLALQNDGRILIGGDFTRVNGHVRKLLARLNPDGSVDASFDPGDAVGPHDDYMVWAIAVQPDGKVLVGGDLGGGSGVKRLLPNGPRDTSFVYGVDPYHTIAAHSIVVEPDGHILIGGTGGLSRLLPDGTIDPAFQQGPADPGTVRAIALQPDGKILAGGQMWRIAGQPRLLLARFNADGSLDDSFQPVSQGTNGSVTALALQPDGKILFGGDFPEANGVAVPCLARCLPDGTLDPAFRPSAAFSAVNALALQPDGKLLVGHQGGIARLRRDGSTDPLFGTGPVIDPEIGGYDVYQPGIHALLQQPDGRVVLSGGFQRINGHLRRCIARLAGTSSPCHFPHPAASPTTTAPAVSARE